jgi:quercetin dioxygenase-like cupin family protein
MEKLTILTIVLAFFTSVALAGSEKTPEKGKNSQIIYKAGTQKSFKGPEDFFTGDVQVDMLFPSNETAHYSGAYVTFQPGTRTAWHLHPAGKHMIVTSGVAF